ncbi:MAG TPA: dipeptidase [Thermoanaerobaculia bacterium]|nr:dipeptidase [Thermoanaerobaculia bacterium]
MSFLVFDGHTDVPTRLLEAPADLSRPAPGGHVDLPRLRRGGVGGLVFALWVPPHLEPEAGLEHALLLHRLTVEQLRPGGLEAVATAAALEQAKGRDAVGVVLGLENGRPLSLPGALDRLHGLGVRIVTLTHTASHEWCDAAGDDEPHGGLAPQGEEMVRELNRRGIVVDVSHVSDRAVEHVLEVSEAPVVASHSSARALCDHPRNLTDALALSVARRGGVVMANAYPAFLDDTARLANQRRMEHLGAAMRSLQDAHADDPLAFARARQGMLAGHPQPPVPRQRYVDHILHLVEVCGEEGVGVGSDFDGIPETPVGFEDVARYPGLVAALRQRGLDGRALELVLWGNFARVWRAVERAAATGDRALSTRRHRPAGSDRTSRR